MEDTNQAEHEQISTALEVEQLEVNLFRSRSLWHPKRGNGVFGGQVISQALVSATNCVDASYGLHSMHCYFLLSASPSVPIVYQVERLREGRSYTTRSVKALQHGEVVFIMMCSFQKPEPWQPSHQWRLPDGIPQPDDCELEEVRYSRMALQEDAPEKLKLIWQDIAAERSRSPISVKSAGEARITKEGQPVYMYWMKARDVPKYPAPFQKCILSYLSDLYLISTGSRTLGLHRFGKGPNAVGMMTTIDHTIYFYDDNFDCGDWLLYAMMSPRTGSGRGIIHGRLYTQSGTLIAVTTQEGVVRADRRAPTDVAKL